MQIPGVETILYSKEKDVPAKLLEMTGDGPDVGIEVRACSFKHMFSPFILCMCEVLLLEWKVKDCVHTLPLQHQLAGSRFYLQGAVMLHNLITMV